MVRVIYGKKGSGKTKKIIICTICVMRCASSMLRNTM